MGLASVTKDRSPDTKRTGLTSAGNVAFVQATGLYDEVIAYDDFVTLGSEAKVKEAGKMRVEGKAYVVKDGDVMHFLFNT